MSQFWSYFKLGLEHVLNWNGYDNILLLIVLVAAFSFSAWKQVFWLVILFTLGHTIALFLSVYGVVTVSRRWIELLVTLTILLTALYNMFTAKKKESQKNMSRLYFSAAFFGLIHGLGIASNIGRIFPGDSKLLPMLEFSLGIGAAQIIVVLVVMVLAIIAQNFFRVTRRDWILVLSAIVIGIILPILRENLLTFF